MDKELIMIHKIISSFNDGVSPSEILDKYNEKADYELNSRTLHRKLKKLIQHGYVQKPRYGVYFATPESPNEEKFDVVFKMEPVVKSTSYAPSRHPGYRTWYDMIRRCYHKSSHNYKWYGEIGVEVCEEWREGPIDFLVWYEENWKENCTLDRIDPYGNYEPSNCRFATKEVQARNQRRHIQ